MFIVTFGATTECRATFEALSFFNAGSAARQWLFIERGNTQKCGSAARESGKVYKKCGSAARQAGKVYKKSGSPARQSVYVFNDWQADEPTSQWCL